MPHELSSASILKPPRIQPLDAMNSSQSSLASMKKVPIQGKQPFNRLVPVPPPKGFMTAASTANVEEEKYPQKP